MKTRHAVLVTVLLLATAVGAGGAAVLVHTWSELGRTPGEVIAYVKRRLQGHPRLEAAALPVLDRAGPWLGVPSAADRALPFAVPPLPPNPAANRPLRAVDGGAAPPPPGVLRVGRGRPLVTLADAARQARDGDVIEIDPGDYVADVAVWDRARLTLRGMGPQVRLIAAGADAEGKAIWVIRRGDITIENIQFFGARVADGNGAAIRLEGGHLTVRRCLFQDNQNGILAGNNPEATLQVEDSEFGYNGSGTGTTHNLYVGHIARLSVSGSHLHHANVGHLIKSRARVSRIAYNRLADGSGGRASYELEFPNGGRADVVGNLIEQGHDTRNSTLVSYGAEGLQAGDNRLRFVFNTVVNDQPGGGTFVRVTPGAASVLLRNNLYVGAGRRLAADGVAAVDAAGEHGADWSDFVRPGRGDYHLSASAIERFGQGGLASLPGSAPSDAAADLLPRAQFQAPLGTQPLAAPARLPGAFQQAGR